MRARANSTMRVTQRQHGHMHVKVNPTIQITAPTREIMRDKKAKGKPRRNPRGLNLQSSPQQQHMAIYLMA